VALREPDSGLPRMLESGRRIGGQQSRLETNFVGLDAGLGKPVADVGRVEIGPNPNGSVGRADLSGDGAASMAVGGTSPGDR
jgi:hypothetical protein